MTQSVLPLVLPLVASGWDGEREGARGKALLFVTSTTHSETVIKFQSEFLPGLPEALLMTHHPLLER